MPWARLEDGYFTHRKVADLSKDAKLLDLAAIAFSARELRDGELTRADIRIIAAQVDVENPPAATDELVAAGRWVPRDGGWEIHDYLVYNPTREEVLRERSMREVRKGLYNDPFLTERVRKRDGDLCRYCALRVRWNDRKSAGGGTYDHVDPEAGNSDQNVVVACRGCNSRKGKRTPEQAGMSLLPAPPSTPTPNGHLPETYRESAGILPETHTESGPKSMHPDPDPDPDPVPVNPDPSPVPDSEPGDARATRGGSECQSNRPIRSRKTRSRVPASADPALPPPSEDLCHRIQAIGHELGDDNVAASITRATRYQAAEHLEDGRMAHAVKDAFRRTRQRMADPTSNLIRGSPMAYFLGVLENTAHEQAVAERGAPG